MRKGFTLIELVIAMAILVVLMISLMMVINPVATMQKGGDARMKKDLSRIRMAFEEYRNDKKSYPDAGLVALLMTKANCGTAVFAPWLASWPCNTSGNPYQVMVGENPQWFKVLAKLDNKKDRDIPEGKEQAAFNYGVSSTNVLWYEGL